MQQKYLTTMFGEEIEASPVFIRAAQITARAKTGGYSYTGVPRQGGTIAEGLIDLSYNEARMVLITLAKWASSGYLAALCNVRGNDVAEQGVGLATLRSMWRFERAAHLVYVLGRWARANEGMVWGTRLIFI